MKCKIVLKGGAGSGNHGHSGRPGKVGGSSSGGPSHGSMEGNDQYERDMKKLRAGGSSSGASVKKYNDAYSWPMDSVSRGSRITLRKIKDRGIVDHIAVVGNYGKSTLKKAKVDTPDGKFYMANFKRTAGEFKKVRIVGFFDDGDVPKVGDRVAVMYDGGKAGSVIYFGDVIEDTEENVSLWHYY